MQRIATKFKWRVNQRPSIKKKAESVQCVPINMFLNGQDLLNVLNVILASVQVYGVNWTELKNKFDINWRSCD